MEKREIPMVLFGVAMMFIATMIGGKDGLGMSMLGGFWIVAVAMDSLMETKSGSRTTA